MTAFPANAYGEEDRKADHPVVLALFELADDDALPVLLAGGRELGIPELVLRGLWRRHDRGRVGLLPPDQAIPHRAYFRWQNLVDRVQKKWVWWGNAAQAVATCGLEVQLFHCEKCRHRHAFEKHCRIRYCPDCVGGIRARTQKRVEQLVEHFKNPPRFLTLTRRNCRQLAGSTTEIKKAFARLRRLKRIMRGSATGRWFDWDDVVRGGVYSVEITENLDRRDDRVWHTHQHHLVDANTFLPRNWLTEAWQRANGCKCPRDPDREQPVLCKHSRYVDDGKGAWWRRFQIWREHAIEIACRRVERTAARSLDGKRTTIPDVGAELGRIMAKNKCRGCDVEPTGVDVRAAGVRAVRELCKYVGKSLKASTGMMAFRPALKEFLRETWGRRMLSAYGALHGAQEKDEREPRVCEECGGTLVFDGCERIEVYRERAPPAA